MPIADLGDVQLHYVDDDFADPWIPHDTVLMGHHMSGTEEDFRGWVPGLARDFRVLRMVRRGNGLSSKPPLGYRYNVPDLVSDYVRFLDLLRIEKVHYIGLALGGVLGVNLAVQHPDRVQSLVLCTTPLYTNKSTSDNFRHEGFPDGPSTVRTMGTWVWAQTRLIRNRQVDASVRQQLEQLYRVNQSALAPPHVVASLMEMVTDKDFNITGLLAKIQMPTLILSAERNTASSMADQALMKSSIPNSEQIIFENAPMMLAWEQPERCAQVCREFIRKNPIRRAG